MKNLTAWSVGAAALLAGLGVIGLSLRQPQVMQTSASRPDPCSTSNTAGQHPEDCHHSGGHFVYASSSHDRSDDGRSGRGGEDTSSAGHAGFGEGAAGHGGGGE
ncbi:hypothetical protein [Gluconobacter sp.]|uniref:hypothetical protein n=1 Tax=Gluconobacter sp. TaxID=1876758 RepID=UPI0039ECD5D0